MIDTAYQSRYKVIALNSSIQYKDTLRTNGYFWNGAEKYWWKSIAEDELEDEKDWMEKNIYGGSFLGQVELIMPADRYK